MANTFSQIYLHIVFAVKGRENLIFDKWKDELYKFISGIIKNENQKLMIINGMPDHLHLLISVSPDIKISEFVKTIKANSSRFINEKQFVRGKFQWQAGYGCFACNYLSVKNVVKYIENQQAHHKKKTFKEEYVEFLKQLNIEFNDIY
ncbi:MAG: IS200/IS605 family transposase, partial [Bacteroidota bacterium]